MTDRFFEIWTEEGIEDGREEMVQILERHITKNYSDRDEEHQVAGVKKDFESDLPPPVLAEAVGCDISLCHHIRWMGHHYGVIDRRGGRDKQSIAPSVREEIHDRDDGQCVRCETPEEELEDDLELHHIVPLSQGGFNFKENYAYLCPSCHMDAHAGDTSTRRTVYPNKHKFWNEFVEEK